MPPWGKFALPEPKLEMVYVLLKNEQRYYEMSKAELQQDDWGRNLYATKLDKNHWIQLDAFRSAIFGYYVLWLKQKPLLPFQDLSLSIKGHDNLNRAIVSHSAAGRPEVTMEKLADDTHDQDPAVMSVARSLFCAYFMGQDLGAHYFQDAIMNYIVQLFQPGQPIPPALADEVYRRSHSGLAGLRKFLVDYYIWACVPPPKLELPRLCLINGLKMSQIPPLSDYPSAFRFGVVNVHKDVRTEIPIKKTAIISKPLQKEHRDSEIDFSNLENFLCNAQGGQLRCRYHQHTNVDLCFNLMA